jgi:hypothetical protein
MEKEFRTIKELVATLGDVERKLTAGELDLAGLAMACDDARELFERLVVLRHKAREARIVPIVPTKEEPWPKGEAPPKPTPAPEPPATEVAASSSIRLDTRPPEAPPRQVSLIDAIEATEGSVPQPQATKEASGDGARSASTVAEKLEKAAIGDLSKAISLSHKFWFVAELFNGDRIAYDKGIVAINATGDRIKALAFVEQQVVKQLKKPADPEALATFMDLVKRRFP